MYQTSTAFVQQMDTRPFRVVVSGDRGTLELDTLEYNAGWCPTAYPWAMPTPPISPAR